MIFSTENQKVYWGKLPLQRTLVTAALLILLGVGSISKAAIVNIEDLRPEEGALGSSGKLDLSFSRSQGNTNVLSLQGQNALAWVREHSESLFILNYRYGESGDEVNINQGLVHLRHVRPVGSSVAAEIFTQAQKDEFKRLTYRVLAGANLRAKLVATEKARLFLGLGGFHSHERLAENSVTTRLDENTFRANTYLSYRYGWSEDAFLSSTIYYQPKADEPKDFHILWDNSLRINLISSLQLKLSYELLYDSRPPRSVAATDQRHFTGLSWSY